MRDRAFILGLFGSGCRIGEFLPLRRRDVVFDEHSCQILVDGKTGSRRVRLTPAASVALAAWLDVNPNKQPDAPVWINIQVRQVIPDRCLSYDWAHEMLRGLARRAGIKKPIRPHLLRHSLATYYAPRLTEAVMNEHFGWRQGGRTASVYTHLSGKQVDDQILAVFGKKRIDLETNTAVDVVRCLRCGLENVPTAVQCGKCGFPLSDEAARRLLQRRQMADAILDRLTSRPEFVEAVEETLAKEGLGGSGGMTDGNQGAGGMERSRRPGESLAS
jgi:ribosomal protein L40E